MSIRKEKNLQIKEYEYCAWILLDTKLGPTLTQNCYLLIQTYGTNEKYVQSKFSNLPGQSIHKFGMGRVSLSTGSHFLSERPSAVQACISDLEIKGSIP